MGSRKSKPQEDVLLHPAKCTFWYAFFAVGIVGLVFLDENVNSERFGALLEENFIPFSKEWIIILMTFFYNKIEYDHILLILF
jgi:hypothetical protein